jgi:hypothetical protein
MMCTAFSGTHTHEGRHQQTPGRITTGAEHDKGMGRLGHEVMLPRPGEQAQPNRVGAAIRSLVAGPTKIADL